MAGKPIKVRLDVDTQSSAADLRRFADKLDEVADATKDTDKAMSDAARTLSGELRRDLDRAERSADDLARTYDRDLTGAFKDTAKEAKRTGDVIDRETRDATGKASGYTSDFKDEARQNFAETASSFDGSMESVADLAQSTLGGMAGAGGPIALATAALGAMGGALYASMAENAAKVEQRISDMYDDLIESGQNYLSREYVLSQVDEIVKGSEDAIITMTQAEETAAATGATLADVMLAYAGDADAGARLTQAIADTQDEIKRGMEGNRDLQAKYNGDLATARTRVQQVAREWETSQDAVRRMTDLVQTQRNAAAQLDAKYSNVPGYFTDARYTYDAFVDATRRRTPSTSLDLDTTRAEQKFNALKRKVSSTVFVTKVT